jgi:type VI secretion system secreted protein Hcp
MKRRSVVLAATILAIALLAGGAWGAVDMFLKMDEIQGESNDDKHKGEIDVLSWSWAVKTTPGIIGGGGAGAGRPVFSDLTIRKYVDKASPNLFFYSVMGRDNPTATLTVRKAGGSPIEFFKIKLYNCLVTSVANGGTSADDRPLEDITLNYSKIEMTYVPTRPDGSPDAPIMRGFDLTQSKGF